MTPTITQVNQTEPLPIGKVHDIVVNLSPPNHDIPHSVNRVGLRKEKDVLQLTRAPSPTALLGLRWPQGVGVSLKDCRTASSESSDNRTSSTRTSYTRPAMQCYNEEGGERLPLQRASNSRLNRQSFEERQTRAAKEGRRYWCKRNTGKRRDSAHRGSSASRWAYWTRSSYKKRLWWCCVARRKTWCTETRRTSLPSSQSSSGKRIKDELCWRFPAELKTTRARNIPSLHCSTLQTMWSPPDTHDPQTRTSSAQTTKRE